MSGELAGAADIATGALIASAIESGAVESDAGKDGRFEEGNCLNCSTALSGPYCHGCGQQVHLHRTLGAFWHDLLHGVLHFEGKIWKTLPLLAFKPGDLTRRYIHGERAKFVSPMALFLFSVFVMFATLSIFGTHLEGGQFSAGMSDAYKQEIASLDTKIKAVEVKGGNAGELLKDRRAIETQMRLLKGGALVVADDSGDPATFKTGWKRLDKGIAKANQNPNLLLYKLQTNAYKFSWMLIPISVPFLWLLFFWRRDLKVYDHTIFVTYSLAFMTLLGTVVTLLMMTSGVVVETIAMALAVVPPVHIYRQLRGAYNLSRISALIRTILLAIAAFIVVLLFILLLFGLGLVG